MSFRSLGGVALLVAALFSALPINAMSNTERSVDSTLVGNWKMIELTVNGEQFPSSALSKAKMEIHHRSLTMVCPPNGTKHAAIASVADDNGLQTIELVISGGNFDGQTVSGIYNTDEDFLTFCLADVRSTTTPRAFASSPGTYHSLMRFEKVVE